MATAAAPRGRLALSNMRIETAPITAGITTTAASIASRIHVLSIHFGSVTKLSRKVATDGNATPARTMSQITEPNAMRDT